jgi:hypothetical protein
MFTVTNFVYLYDSIFYIHFAQGYSDSAEWLAVAVLLQPVTTVNMNIDCPPKKAKGNTYSTEYWEVVISYMIGVLNICVN